MQADSNEGPPADNVLLIGWVRVGYFGEHNTTPSQANCDAYTELSDQYYGTTAALPSDWTDSALQDVCVWQIEANQCFSHIQVWCIED